MNARILLIATASLFFVGFINNGSGQTSKETIEDLLTSKTWKYDEVRVVYRSDKTTYYKRDVFGTEYDSDSVKFSADKAGYYYSQGRDYKIAWSFLDELKTKMKLTIYTKPAQTVYLENISVSEFSFRYAQYDAVSTNATYIASCTRTPN